MDGEKGLEDFTYSPGLTRLPPEALGLVQEYGFSGLTALGDEQRFAF